MSSVAWILGGMIAAAWITMPANASAAAPLQIAAGTASFTLANGLQVVVIPDHRSPTATQMVWYKVGAADEQSGKSGVAHLLELLMFNGTREHPSGSFGARVAEVGGIENAFTSHDYTAFYETVAKQHLRLMMEFEADRMHNLLIGEPSITPERQVNLEERRYRTENNPTSVLAEAVNAALFQNSHYRTPVIGWAHEMAGLSAEDEIDWYNRYYMPNNAVLVVAGDVSPDEVKTMAEATYGKVPPRDATPRIRGREPEPLAARTVTLSEAGVSEPAVQRSYLVPSYHTAGGAEAEALDVLAEILGGDTTSRLYRALVVEKRLAVGASADYVSFVLDDTRFSIYATPRASTSLASLSTAIDDIVSDLIDGGVTDDELARAKDQLVTSMIYAQDSQYSMANYFGEALAVGLSVSDAQNLPDRINKVTADQVVAAAKKYLDVRRSVTGFLIGARTEAVASLRDTP